MSEKLKPCPFCGGDASVGHTKVAYFVNCPDCLVATNILVPDSGQTKADVIDAWNIRAPDTDLTARLAAAYAVTSAALTELALGNGPSLEAYDRGIAEGERRATAAIVAWLRDDAADGKTPFQLARAIERGDHLTSATPPPKPAS